MDHLPVDKDKQGSNLQDNNVGNLGDIIKHAALLDLAKLIQSRNPTSTIHYVDTHAYKFIARLANSQWREDLGGFLQDHPAYKPYYDLEKPLVAQHKYMCSSAIVVEVMPNVSLHLSEQDSSTRQLLITQLMEFGTEPATLLSDAREWCTLQTTMKNRPLLMLLDPFKLSSDCWQSALCAISKLHKVGSDGLLLVFTCDKENNRVAWPLPPRYWKGPVTTINNKPYFMAAYATENIRTDVQHSLAKLGWSAHK